MRGPAAENPSFGLLEHHSMMMRACCPRCAAVQIWVHCAQIKAWRFIKQTGRKGNEREREKLKLQEGNQTNEDKKKKKKRERTEQK